MGGEMFRESLFGDNAEEAFNALREEALYDFGHSGYTGTIAEKCEYKIVAPPEGLTAEEFADKVESLGWGDNYKGDCLDIKIALSIYADKWGPALCIPSEYKNDKGQREYTFLGIASA